MELFTIFIIGAALVYLIVRPMVLAQRAAAKIVEQQHLIASDGLIAGFFEHTTNAGQLNQVRGLFDEARTRQGDGTIRVGHVAWVTLKLDGRTNEAPPRY